MIHSPGGEWMKKRWRFERSRSPPEMLVMRRCCRNCSIKSLPIRTSDQSQPPLGRLLRNRLPGNGRGLRYSKMPRRDCCSQCSCCHSTAQERQAMEAHERRSRRPERSRECIAIPRPRPVATMERIPPPKPRRGQTSRDHAVHNPGGHWMHCVKLMGQSLMARDFDRQVAEIQVRIAVLNRYTALGIPITEAVG